MGITFVDLGTQNIPEGLIGNIDGDMKIQNRFYLTTGCRGGWYGDVQESLTLNKIDKENLNIYPNPAKDYLQIAFPDNTSYNSITITIYDLQGRQMRSQILKDSNEQINVSNLLSGIYSVTVTANDKIFSTKLIIEKK